MTGWQKLGDVAAEIMRKMEQRRGLLPGQEASVYGEATLTFAAVQQKTPNDETEKKRATTNNDMPHNRV